MERHRGGDPKRESKGQRERLREMGAEVSREIIRDRDEEMVQRERRGWGKRLGTQINGDGINSPRLNQVEVRQRRRLAPLTLFQEGGCSP